MLGPGDGGYQVVGRGQSGFVGGTVDERPVLDVGVPVSQQDVERQAAGHLLQVIDAAGVLQQRHCHHVVVDAVVFLASAQAEYLGEVFDVDAFLQGRGGGAVV